MLIRRSRLGRNLVRSMPFPTTCDRPADTTQRNARRSSTFWYSSMSDARAASGFRGEHKCPSSKAVAGAQPQSVAGVHDDWYAGHPTNQSANHAGLRVVRVQHVEVQPLQRTTKVPVQRPRRARCPTSGSATAPARG